MAAKSQIGGPLLKKTGALTCLEDFSIQSHCPANVSRQHGTIDAGSHFLHLSVQAGVRSRDPNSI